MTGKNLKEKADGAFIIGVLTGWLVKLPIR